MKKLKVRKKIVGPEDMLAALQAEYHDCEFCDLCKSRGQVVFGSGNSRPKVVGVAEAPGAVEDETGLPLIGLAGQKFWGCVRAAGSNPKQWYVTNAALCRPVGNRRPHAEELFACRSRLIRQLAILSPSCLLLMGGTAATLLGSIGAIGRNRGVIKHVELYDRRSDTTLDLPAVVTWHPSYLNRIHDPKVERQFINDITLAVESRVRIQRRDDGQETP